MVADMVADKKNKKTCWFLADMELDMVADKEVDKVTDMVAGHGCWLIGPKLFRPEVYPACASSNLCVLICFHLTSKCLADPQLKNGFSDVGRQMVESRVIIVIINIKNFISE